MKAWPAVDTPAWFGRDLEIFPAMFDTLSAYKAHLQTADTSPHEVLYVTDFQPEDSPEQISIMERFIENVTEKRCRYRRISIKDDWKQKGPAKGQDLEEYLYHVRRRLCRLNKILMPGIDDGSWLVLRSISLL